jgi:hypothetical protein
MSLGSYEDNRAATIAIAEDQVRTALRRIEQQSSHWRAVEADPRSSAPQRSFARKAVRLAIDEFSLQWANVKFLLEERRSAAGNGGEVA